MDCVTGSCSWHALRVSRLAPNGPRGIARFPECLERPQVAECVHRLPEAAVPKGHELPVSRKSFQWLPLEEDLVTRDPIEDRRFENKESAIDPRAVAQRLLLE